ncbi:sporulation protein [Paenibacillus sp. NRS-1775]
MASAGIGKIDIELKTEYIEEHDDKKTTSTCCIARVKVSDGFHYIEKLELIMQLEPEGVHVLVEVDRRGAGGTARQTALINMLI